MNPLPKTNTPKFELVKDRAEEINQLHAEICSAARTSIEAAIRIGQLLEEQRKGTKHGEWLAWPEANVQFTQKTANNYQRLFRHRGKLETVSNLTDAYRIAVPKSANKSKGRKEAKDG